mmetsp:Transcript_27199/g.79268  ORF Transcript_27199/g.79268 Transcript_27199/m.79268 type:complete len:434 (-) Transcript_27199:116-1417(-)
MAITLVVFLVVFATQLHHEEHQQLSQAAVQGAPVPAAPGLHPQSPVLKEKANLRRRATHKARMQISATNRSRMAGPFPNLPGPVGNIKFAYPDVLPQPDLATYPPTRSLLDMIEEWNPDEMEHIPNPFVETLQVFDYSDPEQRAMAERYRDAEVPFKVYNVPDVDNVTLKWTDEYLTENMEGRNMRYKVEKSKNNHFMYYVRKRGSSVPPPTDLTNMRYPGWLKRAHHADQIGVPIDAQHYYLQCGVQSGKVVAGNPSRMGQFISSDLPIFSTTTPNFFVTNANANKGIQCRFGMKGVIAEAHYDAGKNMVAMLKGAKRYVLAAPTECPKLGLIRDKGHPSYRHSKIDWSNFDEAKREGFAGVRAIDTIVHEGEVLYIPSYWIHYIISLDYSIQCNTRSGSPLNGEGEDELVKCMGADAKPTGLFGRPLYPKS